jgi:hypothetical protein
MKSDGAREDEMTAAGCLAVLKVFHGDERCRRCNCLDWALAELQDATDPAVAREAALLRVRPERLHPPLDCHSCAPLDATVTWLLSGRHIADL